MNNVLWPQCIQSELKKEKEHKANMDVKDESDAKLGDDFVFPKFEFIDPSLVRSVENANIACLEPCSFLEDCIQYHDELITKGISSNIHKKVHDTIGVANCESSADLTSQCKMAFKDKFSHDLVMKYARDVGINNEYGEPY